MGKHRYELLLVIEADNDAAAHEAANAAWYAAEYVSGAKILDSVVRVRLANGSLEDVTWDDWSEEPTAHVRVRYDDHPELDETAGLAKARSRRTP